MTPTLVLLNIIGGVCLLLWGLRGVRNGMTRAFGADLQRFISRSTSNRFKAFLSGIGVTALLQSSTATALIVASFCGRGLMTVGAGLAVMLGADVGTTLVAQVLSFDVSWLAPLMIVTGYIVYTLYKNAGKWGHVGKLLIGLGLMLFALLWIKQSSLPLKESEVLAQVLQSLENDPILAVALTAMLTWMAHSSLAIVLLLMSLVVSGVLPLVVGLSMVLGANLGGVFAPLLATMRDSREACRVPLGNLIMRLIGVVVALPLIPYIAEWITIFGDTPERMIVNFHTLFNIALAASFIMFTDKLAAICTKILPDKKDPDDPKNARYLDEKQLDNPAIALSGAMRETLRMADIAQTMLEDTIKALKTNDAKLVAKIRQQDDTIDSLYKAVKMYMAKLTKESLDPDEASYYMQILSFSSNIENVGDTIDNSVMDMAQKKITDKVHFSDAGWEEIQGIHKNVLENLRLAQSVFVSGDVQLARKLIESKEKLRLKEQKTVAAHLERIREGVSETIATSSIHLDIIRDFRRINSYVATVAYPILEETGQLRSSRLRKMKK